MLLRIEFLRTAFLHLHLGVDRENQGHEFPVRLYEPRPRLRPALPLLRLERAQKAAPKMEAGDVQFFRLQFRSAEPPLLGIMSLVINLHPPPSLQLLRLQRHTGSRAGSKQKRTSG